MAMDYTSLKADIATVLQRTDLTTYIPTFIDYAERRIARELQPLGFRVFASSTMTAGSTGAIITQPTRLTSFISFVVLSNAAGTGTGAIRHPVRERKYSFIRSYWPDQTLTGLPKFFAQMDNNNVIVAPSPVAAFVYEMAYRQRLAPLSGSNTTNVLTDEFPELLLYASLMESSLYLKDDPRLPVWQGHYDRLLKSAQAIEDHPTDADVPSKGAA